jgi:hypothetical protein
MKVSELLDEGWKDNVASAALVAGLGAGAIGALRTDMGEITHIDGKEYIQHDLPQNKSDIKIKTDDNGNKVYTWVEKAGMKPNYTYYWFSPIKGK